VPLLDGLALEALESLKKRFASSPVSIIRNNFAFHHPTNDQMEAAFQAAAADNSGEDIDWSVFFNRALLNVSFFAADYVFVHGIANALKETGVNVARKATARFRSDLK
jgi:hypothetical protein